MMTISARILLLLCFLLGGCLSIAPPSPTMQCDFVRYRLEVDHPPAGAEAGLIGGPSLADVLAGEETGFLPPTGHRSKLFLSGGSQHGAFGAGFLREWARKKGLPNFETVTGISTGAILATSAFINETELAETRYSISSESQLLAPFIKLNKKGDIPLTAYPTILRKGAVADLAPLRRQLREVMEDRILRKVAQGKDDGRRLLVGVVDVDTGRALALDLTDMAVKYREAADSSDADAKAKSERYRYCYSEAIVASSAVPMAALPVFIDNRMYMDGGARFGAFSEEVIQGAKRDLQRVTSRNEEDPAAGAAPARVYQIMNGDQDIAAKCSKAGWKPGTPCPETDPLGDKEGAHRDWSLLDLALRSEEILVNQVYRFSADYIHQRVLAEGGKSHFVKINDDMPDFEAEIHDVDLEPVPTTKTCAKWRERDRELVNPIQFFPRYMRCLISYGKMRARVEDWASHRND
jgi:patatin-like phospholipase